MNIPDHPAEQLGSPSASERKKFSIIGGGINGLVAANYLARAGHDVTLFERNPAVGGACIERTAEFDGQKYAYPGGASVFGFMQDFVYRDTGLEKRMQGRTYVSPAAPGMILGKRPELGMLGEDEDFQNKVGERGKLDDFHGDSEKVVKFLQDTFRAGIVPTLALARRELGAKLTKRWISGSASELVNHYMTSDPMKMMTLLPVNESGPVSIHDEQTAFTIPLMHSGSAMGGDWGFVRGGLHNLLGELNVLNQEAGVKTLTSTPVKHVDPKTGDITYMGSDGKEHIHKSDKVIFATEPLSAARLIDDKALIEKISNRKLLGTAGKVVAFFKKPIDWKEQGADDAMFRFVFHTDSVDEFEAAAQRVGKTNEAYVANYSELYPEGAADRNMGHNRGHDILSIYFQGMGLDKAGADLKNVKDEVLREVLKHVKDGRELIGAVLLSPRDLQRDLGFERGNIDHVEIGPNQTFFSRGYSSNPKKDYFRFADYEKIAYCGAGTYPCGSVAGTAGYMCVLPELPPRIK